MLLGELRPPLKRRKGLLKRLKDNEYGIDNKSGFVEGIIIASNGDYRQAKAEH